MVGVLSKKRSSQSQKTQENICSMFEHFKNVYLNIHLGSRYPCTIFYSSKNTYNMVKKKNFL